MMPDNIRIKNNQAYDVTDSNDFIFINEDYSTTLNDPKRLALIEKPDASNIYTKEEFMVSTIYLYDRTIEEKMRKPLMATYDTTRSIIEVNTKGILITNHRRETFVLYLFGDDNAVSRSCINFSMLFFAKEGFFGRFTYSFTNDRKEMCIDNVREFYSCTEKRVTIEPSCRITCGQKSDVDYVAKLVMRALRMMKYGLCVPSGKCDRLTDVQILFFAEALMPNAKIELSGNGKTMTPAFNVVDLVLRPQLVKITINGVAFELPKIILDKYFVTSIVSAEFTDVHEYTVEDATTEPSGIFEQVVKYILNNECVPDMTYDTSVFIDKYLKNRVTLFMHILEKFDESNNDFIRYIPRGYFTGELQKNASFRYHTNLLSVVLQAIFPEVYSKMFHIFVHNTTKNSRAFMFNDVETKDICMRTLRILTSELPDFLSTFLESYMLEADEKICHLVLPNITEDEFIAYKQSDKPLNMSPRAQSKNSDDEDVVVKKPKKKRSISDDDTDSDDDSDDKKVNEVHVRVQSKKPPQCRVSYIDR